MSTQPHHIDTGGGSFVGGNVAVGGDFVSRDKNVFTEEAAYNVEGLPSPFLGLGAFTFKERDSYAGREREVTAALRLLTEPGAQHTLLFVTGASGSGKSSFVQAGLMPQLLAHYEDIGLTLLTKEPVVMRPSKNPLAGLAQALFSLGLSAEGAFAAVQPFMIGVPSAPAPDSAVGLLVIDQFEEVFTQSVSDQRDALLAILANLPPFAQLRVHMVCTFRADYLPDLFNHKQLYEMTKEGIDLRAMSVDALTAAIQKPIQALYPDKRFEPSLLDRLAQDAAGDAALLPVLQVALDRLWKSGSLRPQNYTSLIGLFQDHANDVFNQTLDSLDPLNHARSRRPRTEAEKASLLDMLCDMVLPSLDEDKTHDARVRQILPDLLRHHPERAALVRELSGTDARLLSMGQQPGDAPNAPPVETVDIIHEALITRWDVLRQAVDERRSQLEQRRRFLLALNEWREHDEASGYLLSGVRLAEATELIQHNDVELSKSHARRLYDLSMAASAAAQRRRYQIAAGIITVLAFFLILAIWFAFAASKANWIAEQRLQDAQHSEAIAKAASITANEKEKQAESQALAAQAIAMKQKTLDLSLLLSLESLEISPTHEARSALFESLQQSVHFSQYTRGHSARVLTVAFRPDGQVLATGSADHTVILWDMRDPNAPKAIGVPLNRHTDWVYAVAFDRNGRLLATAGRDTKVILWDVSDPSHPKMIGRPFSLHTDWIDSVAFNPKKDILATGSADKTVILWDVRDPIHPREISKPLVGHKNKIWSVAFSPDGNVLASGSEDMTTILWDVSDPTNPRVMGEPLLGHTRQVWSVAFSPNGRMLATGSDDHTVILWDISDYENVHAIGKPLEGHSDRVWCVAFSPDGDTLASAGADRRVVLWDVREPVGGKQRDVLEGHVNWVNAVAFSPNGKTLATGSDDAALITWPLGDAPASLPLFRALSAHRNRVTKVAYSPNGKILATGSWDDTVILWDVTTSQAPKIIGTPLNKFDAPIMNVAFRPDGHVLAIATTSSITLWSVISADDPKLLGELPREKTTDVQGVSFSPDGRMLATSSQNMNIVIWDVTDPTAPTMKGLDQGRHTDYITSLAFNRDGRLLATGSYDKSVIFWDVSNPAEIKVIGKPLKAFSDRVLSVAFSPDGKILATGDGDRKVILWDITNPESPKMIGKPLDDHTDWVNSVVFSDDGRMLASASADHTAILWDVSDPTLPEPLGNPLKQHTSWAYTVAFSPDGKTLATGAADNKVFLWNISIDYWKQKACYVANRNLSISEWKRYMGSREYRQTCPKT